MRRHCYPNRPLSENGTRDRQPHGVCHCASGLAARWATTYLVLSTGDSPVGLLCALQHQRHVRDRSAMRVPMATIDTCPRYAPDYSAVLCYSRLVTAMAAVRCYSSIVSTGCGTEAAKHTHPSIHPSIADSFDQPRLSALCSLVGPSAAAVTVNGCSSKTYPNAGGASCAAACAAHRSSITAAYWLHGPSNARMLTNAATTAHSLVQYADCNAVQHSCTSPVATCAVALVTTATAR